MRTLDASRRRLNLIVITLCLACAAIVAALAFGDSSARVRQGRSQAGRIKPDAPITGVILESVVPIPGLPDEAVFTFKNVSAKSVASIGYGKTRGHDGHGVSYAPMICVPDPAAPGQTFERVFRPSSISEGYQLVAVVYTDGSVEGVGPVAASIVREYNVAVRTLRAYAAEAGDDAMLAARLERDAQAAAQAVNADGTRINDERGGLGAVAVRARLTKKLKDGKAAGADVKESLSRRLASTAVLFQLAAELPHR